MSVSPEPGNRWLRAFMDLSVARKLHAIMAVMLVGLAAIVALGIRCSARIGDELSRVGRQQLPAVRNMTLVDMMHDGIRAGVYHVLLAAQKQDPDELQSSRDELHELCGNLGRYMANLGKLEIAPATREAIDAAQPVIEAYVGAAAAVERVVADPGHGALDQEMTAFEERFGELEERLEALGDLIEKDAELAVRHGESVSAGARWQSLIALVIVGGIALAFAAFVGRAISRPLCAAVEVLESGDLTRLGDVRSRDEIGRMAQAVIGTVDRIERQKSEMARVVSMMENAPINMLYADETGVVRYQNPASARAVARIADALGVAPEAIVGGSLAVFLRTYDGRLPDMGTGGGLPFRAEVAIGDDTVELLVTALRDHQGRYLGPMLTWEIKTEQVRLQLQNQRMAEERQRQTEREAELARERAEAERLQAEEKRAHSEREQRRIAEQAERERAESQEMQRKIDLLLGVVDQAAKGDLRQRVPIVGDDALGRVGGALDVLLSDLRTSVARIAGNADQLAGSADGLRKSSSGMRTAADTTSREMNAVSGASEQVSRSVQSVATATDELSARVREIAASAAEATRVAVAAVEAAGTTEATMSRLSVSSQEIGEVVKLIHSIAQQTNLLALNATIEAARAGEAGRGFAVVANEVKELANATSRATGEIGRRIDAIQGDTEDARGAIARIGGIVHEISDIQATIAAAVEEQNATTREIARTLSEAANGSTDIVRTIGRVAGCATETSAGAQASLESAESLAGMADDLAKAVGAFRY
ncbi:MAG: methyl-accepting chemotaxis protein [Planctomycetota bacterium]